MESRFQLGPFARVAFESPADEDHFFGYYTHSPVSRDSRFLLAHRVAFDSRPITANDRGDIGYFTLATGRWTPVASTAAFNWQQGAMLQWLGPDFQSKIIYNDQEGDRFVARIVDLTTGGQKTLPQAIYAVHPSARHALGVRFERHYFTRAYHYEGIRDDRWNVPLHPEDGILALDLESGDSRLILRTADVAAIDPLPEMANTAHWLEHLLWNPSGTRFAFFHRYQAGQGHRTRVFTADADASNLFCLPGYTTLQYSHMAWRGDDAFAIYCGRPTCLGRAYAAMAASTSPLKTLLVRAYRAAKRILPKDVIARTNSISGYALFRDRQADFRMISTGRLREDGHPSWTRDGRFMLTDTYADAQQFRHLLLYDSLNDRVHELGRFYSPYNECGHRCDLHPRFSFDERYAIIDTAHTGHRQLMLLELDLPGLGNG